jgi:hypothetical protein
VFRIMANAPKRELSPTLISETYFALERRSIYCSPETNFVVRGVNSEVYIPTRLAGPWGRQHIGGHVLGDYCIKRIAALYKPYETKPSATQSLGKAISQLTAAISGVHLISVLCNS